MAKTKPVLVPVQPTNNRYELDQCALYKVRSKKRLAQLLFTEISSLTALSQQSNNYKNFIIPGEACIFTGKATKSRKVQEPKRKLREVHQRILSLLSRIHTSEYAHAAIQGKSYRSNALAHVSADCIATYDLRKFYPSTSISLVYRFWVHQMKCSPDVAELLTKLTCYESGLPTGSPLSPLLSLLSNKLMLDEMYKLALVKELVFTCYIDDLTFSGKKIPLGLTAIVTRAALRFGHSLSIEKTRIFRKADVEKHVTGTVIRNGQIQAPHNRFKKARKIVEHMAHLDSFPIEKIKLAEKLAGVLSEAAFLDKRHSMQAITSRIKFQQLKDT